MNKSIPYRLELAEKIFGIIKSKFAIKEIDLNFLEKHSIFNNFTNIGNHNAFDFLTEINREFNIGIEYKRIFLYELEYLNNLVDLVYKHLNIRNSNNLEKVK